MILNVRAAWQCLFSPRLFKTYYSNAQAVYQPNALERMGDKVIKAANALIHIGFYTSPLICMFIYKTNIINWDNAGMVSIIVGGLGCMVAMSFLIRGIGRSANPKYMAFLQTLLKVDNINALRKFDFEFDAWPVTYSVPLTKRKSWLPENPLNKCANPYLPGYQRAILQLLAFAATHTFGLRLIYPGSLSIVQTLLASALTEGRTQLVEQHDGKRARIGTADGNYIDTMFVDNSGKSPKGNTLLICCEGNSGFYEIGIMATPIKAGYSAIGWNHPGFGGSSGRPYPEEEQNAIDAVMQYAINSLHFKPESIVMFGWSIGGYPAAWAAKHYPVKGLILDATFDDLLPLAQNQMPRSWCLLVKEVVKSHVDLNVAGLVTGYRGPVQLVRRTEDEIICLREGALSTNRANDLLLRLLESRHPRLVQSTADASTDAPIKRFITLQESQRNTLARTDITEQDRSCLKIIEHYMRDYRSSHCTPLPEPMFETIIANINNSPLQTSHM